MGELVSLKHSIHTPIFLPGSIVQARSGQQLIVVEQTPLEHESRISIDEADVATAKTMIEMKWSGLIFKLSCSLKVVFGAEHRTRILAVYIL